MSAPPTQPAKSPRRKTIRPSEIVQSTPSPQSLQRRQSAVIRDLIRLDVTPPRFESEGLALIRSLLEED